MPYKDPARQRQAKRESAFRIARAKGIMTYAEKEVARQERRKRLRLWLRNYKETLACAHCGYRGHHCTIDFHHTDPGDKKLEVSRLVGNSHASIETILAEIAKCIPLCANCHRILHYREHPIELL